MATGKTPGDDTLVYLNQVVGEGRSSAGGSSFDVALAQVDTQRGGAIVADGLDYYVGLQRLVLNTPLPILIGELALPSVDGVSLAYSLTITTSAPGFQARAFFRLPVPPARRVLHKSQPSDEYAFVANLAEFCGIFNDALGRAWTDFRQQVGSTFPQPYVEIADCASKLRLVFSSESEWGIPPLGGSASYQLFFNAPALAILSGWPIRLITQPGRPLDPDGKDVLMLVGRPTGATRIPPPAVDPEGDFSLGVCMVSPVFLPAMRTVRVICSLPSQPELVAGGVANNKTKKIFADLSLEGAERTDGDTLIFNGFVNSGTRYVKLTQSGPITGFSTTIELTDYFGTERICRFLSPLNHAAIKVAFVPVSLIRNYPEAHDMDGGVR